jgi:hypothetical protein
MKRTQLSLAKVENLRKAGRALLTLVVLLLLVSVTLAQSGDGYDLSWWTVDGGGYTFSEGGGYSLGGTIGQPDAGELSDGNYILGGGFWGGGAMAVEEHKIYLPLLLKDWP